MNVLFVCTGNTCRSSMAEGILNDILNNDLESNNNIVVSSAGIAAIDGDGPTPQAVEALKRLWGIDINEHRARKVANVEVNSADIIITMTKEHESAIKFYFPEAIERVFTLKEYVFDRFSDEDIEKSIIDFDIKDPFGMCSQVYESCALELKEYIDKLYEIIKKYSSNIAK